MTELSAERASGLARLAARVSLMAYGPHALESRDPQHYRVLVQSLFSSPTSIILSNVVGAAISLFCWKSSGFDIFKAIITHLVCHCCSNQSVCISQINNHP